MHSFFDQNRHNQPSQIGKEPNTVNVKIEQDYFTLDYFIQKIYNQGLKDGIQSWMTGNHSDFKNPKTMQILQKEMQKRISNE